MVSINYNKYINQIRKYDKLATKYIKMQLQQEKKIKMLKASMRIGTLRGKNPDKFANEEDIIEAEDELKYIIECKFSMYAWKKHYYDKLKKLNEFLNEIGMWQIPN